MAKYTLNDLPVTNLDLVWATSGQWSATVEAIGDTTISSPATLKLGAYTWVGDVLMAGVYHGRVKATITAATGLFKAVEPTHLKGSIDDVLSYLTGQSGVTFELAAPTEMTEWVVTAGTCREAITTIAQHAGLVWRTKRDGTVWLGKETWPASAPIDKTHVELDSNPGQSSKLWTADETPLEPGTSLDGQNIVRVAIKLAPDALDVTAVFELENLDLNATELRLTNQVAPLRYHGLYPARVVSCDFAAQTVDVQPEDPTLPDLGKVRMRSAPGLRIEVAGGQRVLIGFQGGDPDKPFAALEWADNAQMVKATWDVTGIVQIGTGSAQFVALENLVKAQLNDIKTMLDGLKTTINGHTHIVNIAALSTPTPSAPATTPNASTYTVGEVKCAQLKTV